MLITNGFNAAEQAELKRIRAEIDKITDYHSHYDSHMQILWGQIDAIGRNSKPRIDDFNAWFDANGQEVQKIKKQWAIELNSIRQAEVDRVFTKTVVNNIKKDVLLELEKGKEINELGTWYFNLLIDMKGDWSVKASLEPNKNVLATLLVEDRPVSDDFMAPTERKATFNCDKSRIDTVIENTKLALFNSVYILDKQNAQIHALVSAKLK